MSQNEAIELLKNEATNDKEVRTALELFTKRKRTRFRVTVNGLMQLARRSGVELTEDGCKRVLKALAAARFGVIEQDRSGAPIALDNVEVTLQSIGRAVLGNSHELDDFRPKRKFRRIRHSARKTPTLVEAPKQPQESLAKPTWPRKDASNLVLTFMVNGKPVNLSIENDLNAQDIGLIIDRLREKEAGAA
jgi:hypothetical protein